MNEPTEFEPPDTTYLIMVRHKDSTAWQERDAHDFHGPAMRALASFRAEHPNHVFALVKKHTTYTEIA